MTFIRLWDLPRRKRQIVWTTLGAVVFIAAAAVVARALAAPPFAVEAGTPLDVFLLTDGALNWGDADVGSLVRGHAASTPFEARSARTRTSSSWARCATRRP